MPLFTLSLELNKRVLALDNIIYGEHTLSAAIAYEINVQ